MKNFTHHFNYKWLLAALLSLSMLPGASQAQNILFQNFDGTKFPPAGAVAGTSWKLGPANFPSGQSYANDSIWLRNPTSTSYNASGCGYCYPNGVGNHGGGSGGVAEYPSYYTAPGSYDDLITPPLNFAANPSNGTYTISFWIIRYSGFSNTPANTLDVYINTVASVAGASIIGSVTPNAVPSVAPYNSYPGSWEQVTFNIPAAYNVNPTNYIIFRATSQTNYAGDIIIDDVSIDYIPPCNNTPAAPTIVSGPISTGICSGTSAIIAATDAVYSPGISYIWQDSVANGTWVTVGNISGVGGLTFTTPGLFDTTYVRLIDSCQKSHAKTASTNIYKVPVLKYNLPYQETFNAISNNKVPSCYTYNDNYSTNWSVQSGFHSPDGTAMNPLMIINDPAANVAVGKNNFFTIPGLTLQTGNVYAIRFKYARGKDNPYANTGTAYTEHLQVYANSVSPGFQVSKLVTGSLIFDKTINFNSVADTTIYFAPPTSAGYYFSWFSNTPHPGSISSPVDGGTLAVDSVYVNLGTCIAPSITTQPAPVTACLGGPATLSVSAAGTANAYQWKKGGNNIQGANLPTYTIPVASATDAANYSVAISNPCGSVISNSVALSVNNLPIATVSPSTPTAVCSADSTPVTANASGSGTLTYLWKFNDTLIAGAASGPSYIPKASGNYSYIVRDGNGCSVTSPATAITVNVTPPAFITASGPTSFCTGGSVTLNANSAAGLSYKWLYNGTNLPNTTAAQNATASGSYQVKVTLGSCTATSLPTPVSVVSAPTALISASGALHFCNGGSVTLNANTGTGLLYQWRLNGGNLNAFNSTFVATQAGTYDVVVTSGTCSGASNSKTVSIDASPNSTVTYTRPLTFCTGDSVVLSATLDPTATYTWKLGGSIVGGNKSDFVAYASGDYTVSIINSNGCSSVSPITTVAVNPLPSAMITSGSSSICAGTTALLQANTASGLSYQWRLGFVDIPSANGANYPATLAGTYDVLITDVNGCMAKSSPVTVTVNPLPNVVLVPNGPTAFCPGGSVSLKATTDIGGPFTWYKDGSLISGTAGQTSYTATTPGSYTVSSSSPAGCVQSSLFVTVINNTLPGALISLSGATTFCPGGSVLISTPSIGGYTYQWKNSAGNIPNATTSGYTATTAETYSVQVTNNNGCTNTSTTVPVTVTSAPIATIAPAGPTTICSGNNVVLNANTGTGLTYQWKLNGGTLTGGTSSSYTASMPGSYTVDISNSACDVLSSPITVTVNPLPNASINASGATTFCSNSSVTLNAAGSSNNKYQWLKNGTVVNAATGASYTTNVSGNYSVHIVDLNGCSDTSSVIPVTVNPAPVTSISTPGATTLCSGDTIYLFANTGAGVYTYQWYMGGNIIPGAVLPSLNALVSGAYTVNVTSTNGCVAISSPVNATFNPSPVPVITAINNKTTLSTGAFATYQWYFNGKAIPGAKSATYTPTQNGDYMVMVTQGTCTGKSTTFVFPPPINAVTTVNGSDNIKIYPNPASSIVHVDAPMNVTISVASIDGREMMHVSNVKEVNIANLTSGVYVITVYDAANNNVLKIEKLVKTGM